MSLTKVPALAYGSQSSPEQPNSESAKILESLVIVEFIADLYPHAKLVPSDPVLRARTRTFASASNNAIMAAWKEAFGNNNVESILTALDQIQSLLSDGATYAVGDEFTIADISIGPWLGRLEMLFENDFFGKFEKAIVGKVHEIYKSLKYDKLREYNRRLQERPSVKKTYRKVRYLCSLFNNSKFSYQRISKGRRFAILPHKTISEIMNVIFVRDPCI